MIFRKYTDENNAHFNLYRIWMNKMISSYTYIDENNAPFLEIEAGLIHDMFWT